MCAYSFSTSSTNLLQIHFKIFGLTEQIKKTFFFFFGLFQALNLGEHFSSGQFH